LLRRQAAELFLFIPMKTLSAFILGILFPIIVFSQTPIWKSIHISPRNNITMLPSPNGKPFGVYNSIGRITLWSEEQKRWIIDYNDVIDCPLYRTDSYPSQYFANFGNTTVFIGYCNKEPLEQDPENVFLLYKEDNSEWKRMAAPDTIEELYKRFSKSLYTVGGGITVGTDNKLYFRYFFRREEYKDFDKVIVDEKMMVFSKTSIEAPWIKEPDIPSHFFYANSYFYIPLFWGSNRYFIQSNSDTVLIYDNGNMKKILPTGLPSRAYNNFTVHNNRIYVGYANLFRYDDSVWTKIFNKLMTSYLVVNDSTIYCLTIGTRSFHLAADGDDYGDSLYKTTDAGKTWKVVSKFFDPVYADNDGWLYGYYYSPRPRLARSNDDGKTIEIINEGLEFSSDFHSVSAQKDGSLLASGPGVWHSTDEGVSWRSLGLDTFNVKHAFIDDSNYLHATISSDTFPQFRKGRVTLVRSKDMGKSWHFIQKIRLSSNGFYQAANGTIFLPVGWYALNNELFRSTDHGTSWIPCEHSEMVNGSSGKPYEEFLKGGIPAFADDGSVLVPRPLSRSTDNGKSWTFIDYDTLGSCTVVLNDKMRRRLVSVSGNKIHVSYDHGLSWTYLNYIKTDDNLGIFYMVIDSAGNYYAHGSPSGREISYSTDGGMTWTFDIYPKRAPQSPNIAHINYLSVSKRGYVYLASQLTGIYRTTERFPPVGVKEEEERKSPSSLLNIVGLHPNPTSEDIRLEYTISDHATVECTVTNALGIVLYSSLPQVKRKGEHSLLIDCDQWSAGSYYCIINADGVKITLPFIKH
jgi:photosystem II stability/assembly factor-like uncharacterized protein